MVSPYRLVRSKRRTLALVIDREGTLVARAPQRMPIREIEAFIAQKEGWILAKQAEVQNRQAADVALEEGMPLPFWGGTLTLRQGEVSFPFAYHGALLLPKEKPLRDGLVIWLREQAEAQLPTRVAAMEAAMGVSVQRLSFSTARTRWGSMTATGALRLNLSLLLCPPPVVDYVIVHELAHRRHMNHSAAFWGMVEAYLPDYRERRAWLKQHSGLTLLLYGPKGNKGGKGCEYTPQTGKTTES